MKKDISSIFDESGCLGERQMMDYLHGRLNEKEMHALEAHIADCDFCNEALEGLMQVKNKEQIPVIVKQIHRQVHRDLRARRLRRRKVKMYIGLSFVVIIILVILLIAFLAEYYTIK